MDGCPRGGEGGYLKNKKKLKEGPAAPRYNEVKRRKKIKKEKRGRGEGGKYGYLFRIRGRPGTIGVVVVVLDHVVADCHGVLCFLQEFAQLLLSRVDNVYWPLFRLVPYPFFGR